MSSLRKTSCIDSCRNIFGRAIKGPVSSCHREGSCATHPRRCIDIVFCLVDRLCWFSAVSCTIARIGNRCSQCGILPDNYLCSTQGQINCIRPGGRHVRRAHHFGGIKQRLDIGWRNRIVEVCARLKES